MDTNFVNYWGVPGSGKTRTVVAAFDQTVRRIGPERVAYVSFTRTAAEEARQRAAHSLGIRSTSPQVLKARLPFVGTIHSLCYRLLGVGRDQMVSRAKLAEFADLVNASGRPTGFEYVPEELDAPYMLVEGKDDLAGMQILSSTAAHRMISPEEALNIIPVEYVEQTGSTQLLNMVRKYAAWKREHDYLDFDDLLILGREQRLPVACLIADEVQDNSPLLWDVIDRWAQQIQLVVTAGDPFQALYLFNGADPGLFLKRPGRWVHLDTTHRFGQESVEYARDVLKNAYGPDETSGLDGWEGVGGEPRDGTTLCLARTNFLLRTFEADFQEKGIPYRTYRGKKGPLDRPEADAYRTGHLLLHGESVSADRLLPLAATMKLPAQPIKAMGDREVERGEAEALLGRPVRYLMAYLPNVDYYDRVVTNHGTKGLMSEPKHILSTIHGAKGREADNVILLSKWGWIPGRALADPQGNRSETCVAYVACSRHRVSLELWDDGDGYPFPFPDA